MYKKLLKNKIIILGGFLVLALSLFTLNTTFADTNSNSDDTVYAIEPVTENYISSSIFTTMYYTRDIAKSYSEETDTFSIEETIYSDSSDFQARSFSFAYGENESTTGYGCGLNNELSFNFSQDYGQAVDCTYILNGETYRVNFDDVDSMYRIFAKMCLE